MERNKKRHYEPPMLTTVTFKAERGYAQSKGLLSSLLMYKIISPDYNTASLEGFDTKTGWESSGTFWE